MIVKRIKMPRTKNFDIAALARSINVAGNGDISFGSSVSAGTGGETIGSLTASMDSNQTSTITLTSTATPVPIVQAYKEVSQPGVSSKGSWDVNANATNYDFYDEKPISYSSVSLTPSATGDGTFTSSNPVVSGYVIANASLDSDSFDPSSQETSPQGLDISPDGTKLIVVGDADDALDYYTLSTPFDLSSATYDGTTSAINSNPYGCRFSSTGHKIFVSRNQADDVYEIPLSTNYDASTAGAFQSSGNLTTLSGNAQADFNGIHFSSDGTKMFSCDEANNKVHEYTLSTAWDITTLSYVHAFDISSQDTIVNDLAFTDDGTRMFILGSQTGYIYEYGLTQAWDVSSASYSNISLAQTNGRGMTFSNSGQKMYLCKIGAAELIRYSTSSSNVFSSSDVGKKVVGNSGTAVITSTAGAYKSVTAFADTSAISSWQLYGAEGKSDGTGIQLAGFSLPHTSIDNPTHLNTLTWNSSYAKGRAIKISPDGTNFYAINYSSTASAQTVHRFSLSTPFDISTATFAETKDSVGQIVDALWNSNGTKLFLLGNSALAGIPSFVASTPYSLSNMTAGGNAGSLGNNQGGNTVLGGMCFNNDKTKLYISNRETNRIYEYDLNGSAGEIDGGLTFVGSVLTGVTAPMSIEMQSDGTKVWYTTLGDTTPRHHSMTLTTPFQISTAGSSTSYTFPSPVSTGTSTRIFCFNAEQTKMYVSNGSTTENVFEFNIGSFVLPYSQYSPALTNSSSGQINSSTWLDINSMTADETKNDGDIFYAVSTDNRTSWSVAKASDGVRKIARNNSGTWQYNNNAGTTVSVGYDLSNASYTTISPLLAQNEGYQYMHFKPDGTKVWIGGPQSIIYEYDLSTGFDLSTITYGRSLALSTLSLTGIGGRGFFMKSDGTRAYISAYQNYIRQLDLSTAWDITTASYSNVFLDLGSSQISQDIYIKSDGTKLYNIDNNNVMKQYTMTTPWDLSTLTLDHTVTLADSFTYGAITFNSDGTILFIAHVNTSPAALRAVNSYSLSTAWDISSTLTLITNYDIFAQIGGHIASGISFNTDGSKMFIMDAESTTTSPGRRILEYSTGSTTISYSTSETWVNGTNNNEHATLQQALGAQSFNRMNKAQLDAVADGYHFSQDSADTLDLMIAPYAASGVSPISDGVTINYDAESFYRQATPGVDYTADFIGTNRVDITSNISANLKIKVV